MGFRHSPEGPMEPVFPTVGCTRCTIFNKPSSMVGPPPLACPAFYIPRHASPSMTRIRHRVRLKSHPEVSTSGRGVPPTFDKKGMHYGRGGEKMPIYFPFFRGRARWRSPLLRVYFPQRVKNLFTAWSDPFTIAFLGAFSSCGSEPFV